MRWWRQLTRGVYVLTHRSAADRDVEEEFQYYLDESAAALERDGLSPDAARRAARLQMGNALLVRERVRDDGWENVAHTLWFDVRYAVRAMASRPRFASLVAGTLALGIAAATAIFSVVNPVLLQPLPYPNAGRVAALWYRGADGSRALQTYGTFIELTARAHAFQQLAVFKSWQPTITGAADAERLDGQRVTAGYFQVLAVKPSLGRDFRDSDDRPDRDGPKVVILSDSVWRRRFGADATLIGRAITLDGQLVTVIGVMPRGFENVLAPSAEIWTPLQYDPSLPPQSREWGHHLQMIGRLRGDIPFDGARRELDAIARTPVPELPRQPSATIGRGLIIAPLGTDIARAIRPTLVAVMAAVVLLLLLACVNVTSLMLARGVQRRGELAMRVALGAGRGRLIRQLVTETVLLALAGGTLAIVVAQVGARALIALSPPGLPRLQAVVVDRTVFAFALTVTAVVGVVIGIVPALHAWRHDAQIGLQRASSRTTHDQQLMRRGLVIAETALAIVLLVSAGLLLRSLDRLLAVAPGFDPSHLLTMQVQVAAPPRFSDSAAVSAELWRFFAQGLDAVRRAPGVTAAGWTTQLPLSGDDAALETYGVEFERRADLRTERVSAYRYAISPGYFDAMRIPLRRGRLLADTDRAGATVRSVLINESFARRMFGSADPIGQRLRFGGPADRPWDVIVGVVGDVKQTSLAAAEANAVYVSSAQWLWADNPMWLVVRTSGDPAAATGVIRRAIWSLDKDQPVVRVATMDERVETSEAERHFALIVFEAFGLAALALAAIGIYGVLSSSVAERTREIGVRSALGASRSDILQLVAGQAMSMTIAGVVIGIGGAAAASRMIATLLFGVSPTDVVTYAGATGLLLVVSAVACWIPARRAARIDPAITLRAE